MSSSSTLLLGFSLSGATIDAGSGVLVDVSYTGFVDQICLSGVVISNPSGQALDYTLGDCYTPPENPSLSITSPTDGSTLTSYDVSLEFSVSAFNMSCF